jgi:hypothetical protein
MNPLLAGALKSRTMWLVAVLGAYDFFKPQIDALWGQAVVLFHIPAPTAQFWVGVLALVIGILRFVTKTSIAEKADAPLPKTFARLIQPFKKQENLMSNLPVLGALGADIFVAIVVNEGAKGDAAKKATRAQTLITFANAGVQFFSGNQTAALATLASAEPTADPAIAALVTNIIKAVAPLAQIEADTLTGSVVATQAIAGLQEIVTVAQKYIPSSPLAA